MDIEKPKTPDEKIDALLAADTPALPDSFTESVMAAARKISAEEKLADGRIDALLERLAAFPNATDKIMAAVAKAGSSRRVRNSILSCASALAAAACAAVAVFSATADATMPRGVITADDFAEMSLIDEEISGIAALVIQEEFIDLAR